MALQILGHERDILSAAIENAFPNMLNLQTALDFKLNDNIFNYAGFGSQYPHVRFELLQGYNARGMIDSLVVALLEDNPTNEALLRFAWEHSILKRPAGPAGQRSTDDGSLEAMLDPVRGFTNATTFLRRFGEIVKCVCRVDYPTADGIVSGTGFLVGNETVMTNYHVIERAHKNTAGAKPSDIRVLFDYQTGPDGQTIEDGTEYKLVNDPTGWLIDHSPYHDDDQRVRPVPQNVALNRPLDHLDFALLRVAGMPGAKGVGKKPTGATVRGCLPLPAAGRGEEQENRDFAADTAEISIFQHPKGEPPEPPILPLSFDRQKPAILGMNANRTRVFYNVNTRHGSSGAPCFNARLELIALHHAGGRDWPTTKDFGYNQGIPISRICDLLQKRGTLVKIA